MRYILYENFEGTDKRLYKSFSLGRVRKKALDYTNLEVPIINPLRNLFGQCPDNYFIVAQPGIIGLIREIKSLGKTLRGEEK